MKFLIGVLIALIAATATADNLPPEGKAFNPFDFYENMPEKFCGYKFMDSDQDNLCINKIKEYVASLSEKDQKEIIQIKFNRQTSTPKVKGSKNRFNADWSMTELVCTYEIKRTNRVNMFIATFDQYSTYGCEGRLNWVNQDLSESGKVIDLDSD